MLHNIHVGMLGNLLVESAPAVYCGGRGGQTAYFDNPLCAIYRRRQIVGYIAPHLLIVRPDICRVFVGVGSSVEHDYRYSLVIGPVHSLGHLHLPRRHNEQVHTHFHEAVNLLGLQFGIIVCRRYLQLHIVDGEGGDAQFVVELLAPYVFAALRNAYDEFRFPPAAREEYCRQQ